VRDGADGFQFFVEIHRADAVRSLDGPHAADHLATLVEALAANGSVFPPQMGERWLHVLPHRGPDRWHAWPIA
jgi:hypothetical protein